MMTPEVKLALLVESNGVSWAGYTSAVGVCTLEPLNEKRMMVCSPWAQSFKRTAATPLEVSLMSGSSF